MPRSKNSGGRCAPSSPATTQAVENWNSANTVLHYDKDGAFTGPEKEHAETSMPTLHLLQPALVHVNALLAQQGVD